MLPTRRATTERCNDDTGSIMMATLFSMMMFTLVLAISAAVLGNMAKTRTSAAQTATRQAADAAINSALQKINRLPAPAAWNTVTTTSPDYIPTTQAAANTSATGGTRTCNKTASSRWVCSRWWVDVSTVDAAGSGTKINADAWIDSSSSGTNDATSPSVRRVTGIVIAAATWKNGVTQYGTTANPGALAYQVSPAFGLDHALIANTSLALTRPVTVTDYNSATGTNTATTTKRGTAAINSGTASISGSSRADSLRIYNTVDAAGSERCVGDGCTTTPLGTFTTQHWWRTVTAPATDGADANSRFIYAATGSATDPVTGITPATCNTTVDTWIASRDAASATYFQGNKTICVRSNMVIDKPMPTLPGAASSDHIRFFVKGDVLINSTVNTAAAAPRPATLAIYTAGRSVTFRGAATGNTIAAVIYAPNAACTSSDQPVTFYGSLLCDTIAANSVWTVKYDTAISRDATLLNQIPNQARAWAVSTINERAS